MPMRVETIGTAGEVGSIPFVGPINHTAPVRVDPAAFTAAEVDENGYLRPGVLLMRSGAMATAAVTAGESIYGAVVEATKIAKSNTAADLAAAVDATVIVATICTINRAVLEDSLGRALTAGELAAVGAAGGSPIVLIY